MKINLKWNSNMKFTGTDSVHSVEMDANAPIGQSSALTPKQLLVAGLAGCTAMDVAALFKKHKQQVETFDVSADATLTTGVQPAVFTDALLVFEATGNIDKNIFLNAVELSQSKYCGVSAMLAKAFPIRYRVVLNGEQIGEGRANFEGSLS